MVALCATCSNQMITCLGGGLAQWLGCRISDQVIRVSSPAGAPFFLALSKSHLPPA